MKKQDISSSELFISGGMFFLVMFAAFAAPEKIKPKIPDQYIGYALFFGSVIFAMIVYIGVHYLPTKITVPLGLCGWISIPIAILILTR